MSIMKVSHLSFGYNSHKVLYDISFSIEKPGLYGLFGPNGSGKTTLFKCCLGLLPFSEGDITIMGKSIGKDLQISERAKLVTYVPQEHPLSFPFLVSEMVMMGRTPHLTETFKINPIHRQKVAQALDMTGISDLAEKPYTQLSGGQRQMVLLARALAQEVPLMILDEPTSSLDFSNQNRVWKILKTLTARGVTILACSHDPNHIAWFCDSVIMVKTGHIIADGKIDEVFTEENLERVYPDSCSIKCIDTSTVVIPRYIDECQISLNGN